MKEQLDRLETLRQISRSILGGETMQQTAVAAAERLMVALKCQRVGVTQSVPNRPGQLTFLAAVGAGVGRLPTGGEIELPAEYRELELRGGVYTPPSLSALARPPLLREAYSLGLRRLLAFPLRFEGESIGFLTAWSDRVDGFSDRDIDMAIEAADQLSIALHQARLVEYSQRQNAELEKRNEELREYASRLERLRELDRFILMGKTMQETADIAATQLLEGLKCQRVSVLNNLDDRRAVYLASRGTGAALSPAGTPVRRMAGLKQVAPERRLYAVKRPGKSQSTLMSQLYSLGLRTFMVFPMRFEDEDIGNLTVWSDDPNGISEQDTTIASETADRLAIALKQARLSDETQRQNGELEERNEELRAVVYSTTHDLQPPLRAMRGFGEALIEDYGDSMDGPAQDFVRRILGSAARMDELIQDMLAYAQVARAEFTVEPVSLLHAVRAALEQLDGEDVAAGARLTIGKKDASVLAHPPTLTQIAANLISNAIKFVPPGRPPEVGIRVSTHRELARLSVTDNGIGVAAEYEDRIFRLFERLYPVERYAGTGIGLAIVKKAAEYMGGAVGLKSVPGQGSTFWVDLPLA